MGYVPRWQKPVLDGVFRYIHAANFMEAAVSEDIKHDRASIKMVRERVREIARATAAAKIEAARNYAIGFATAHIAIFYPGETD